MKSVFVVLAALTASVVAQVPGLPECANPCVTPFLTKGVDGCGAGDFKCVCSSDKFIDDIGQCIAKDCTEDEMKETISIAYGLCKAAGVDIPTTIPTLSPTSTPTGTNTNLTNSTTTTTGPEETSTDNAAASLIANGLGLAGIAAAVLLL